MKVAKATMKQIGIASDENMPAEPELSFFTVVGFGAGAFAITLKFSFSF
jgi:hypothetical protein